MNWTLLTPEMTLLLAAALFLVLACLKPDRNGIITWGSPWPSSRLRPA
jgi:hypothetical protein